MADYFKCVKCIAFSEGDDPSFAPCRKCGSTAGFSKIDREEALDMLTQQTYNPVSTLIPNGDQERWIEMIGSHIPGKKPRTKVLSAPNKIGKTCATIAAKINIMYGKQSSWFDYPMFIEEWPFPKVCWVASWESALKEVIIPEMIKWFPKDRYSHGKEGKHFLYHWTTDTGWEIFIKSYDQGVTAFESSLIGLCIFSEPPPEEIYDALPARMTRGGMVLIEQTPVPRMNPAWLYDVLEDEGKAEFMYCDDGLEGNCIEHGVRGHLTHQNIVETIAGYSWLERAARETGRPMNLSGAVFKRFSEERHVVETGKLFSDEQIWMVLDPHDRKPPFISWWAINPAMDYRCVFEYPVYKDGKGYEKIAGTTLRISDFVDAIIEIEKIFGYTDRIMRRIMDPYFGSKPYSDTKLSAVQTYNKYLRLKRPNDALFVLGPRQEVGYGTDLIFDKLDYQIRTETEPGFRSKMTFEKRVMNVIRAMRRYSHVNPKTVRDDQELVNAKKQTERWKHAVDGIRYLLASNPYYDFTRAPSVRKSAMLEARDVFGHKKKVETSWITS